MRKKILLLLIPLMLIIWLFTGFYSSGLDPESMETVFFIKKKPTFRVRFYNPKWIPNTARKRMFNDFGYHEQAEYCKYRYGLSGSDNDIIIQCQRFEDLSENGD